VDKPTRILGRFGRVAYAVLKDPSLTMSEKAMYSYLACYIGQNTDSCWPSEHLMAAELNVSASTIKRLIKSLKAKQIITRTPGGSHKTYVTTLLK
jgi:DNA-binding MarR family transcriptional regulator